MLPGAREVEGVPAVVNERVDRPDQAVDRPSFTRLWDIPDRPMDPAMFEGRHMTVWLRQAYERSRAIERAEAGGGWSLDMPVGNDETARDVLRRRYGDLTPDRIRENAEYIEKNAEARPWLKHAEDADPMVQACYVERDRSAGHDLQRHEGWRGEQGQADRVAYLRDPAHAKDDLAYDRSNDAYGQGRLHSCGPIASQIYDPVAYAVAVTRLHEHPDVRRILAGPYDSERAPGSVRDIP